MMHHQHFNSFIAPELINDSVIPFYQFSDILIILFWYHPANPGHLLQNIHFDEEFGYNGGSIFV